MADNWVHMCLKMLIKLELNKSSMSWILHLTSDIRQNCKSGRWSCIVPLHADCWDLGRKHSLKVGTYLYWRKNQSTAYRQMPGDGPELSKVVHCVQQHGKNQHEFLPNIPGRRDAPQEKRVKTYWTYGRRGVTKWGCERVSKSKVKVLIFLALK